MPWELLKNSERPAPEKLSQEQDDQQVIDVDKIPKKPRIANPNNWHPKLKEKLEGPLKEVGFPSFTKIMNFCKKDAYIIFLKGLPVCVLNALFERCFNGDKCTRKHTLAKDNQVNGILNMVEPFMKDPTNVKTGLLL